MEAKSRYPRRGEICSQAINLLRFTVPKILDAISSSRNPQINDCLKLEACIEKKIALYFSYSLYCLLRICNGASNFGLPIFVRCWEHAEGCEIFITGA